nr:MFS transporter [Solobacterium sp.]
SIGMELMDYTIYSTGKDRSALTGVLGKFLEKAQSAVSSALVGSILIAIGYRVDSVTGNYIGDLSKMPTMLTWMIVIIGVLPAVMAVIGILILNKYPINHELRLKIQDYIKNHDAKDLQEN